MKTTLTEELVLLCLDDEEGHISEKYTEALPYGIIGGAIFELLAEGSVKEEDGKLRADGITSLANPIVAEVYQQIKETPDSKTIRDWMSFFTTQNDDLVERQLENLVSSGVLQRVEDKKLLGLMTETNYEPNDPSVERNVRDRLRGIILEDEQPSIRDAFLVAVVKPMKLIPELFSQMEQGLALNKANRLLDAPEYRQELSGNHLESLKKIVREIGVQEVLATDL